MEDKNETIQSIPPSPAQNQNYESEADKQAKLEEQRREMEFLKQRQAEEEKIQKMKILHEQQKAKRAAEKAAKAA